MSARHEEVLYSDISEKTLHVGDVITLCVQREGKIFCVGSEGYVDYLKCVCEGLSHQIALRSVVSSDSSEGSSSQRPQGKYKTLSGIEVNVHPNSTMFQRNPAPSAVVFTEIIVTKKTYITGVTQVKKDWVTEFHPDR